MYAQMVTKSSKISSVIIIPYIRISKVENIYEDLRTSFLSIAELGDYQPDVHDPDLVSEFLFYPNQDERMELNIFERFKELR